MELQICEQNQYPEKKRRESSYQNYFKNCGILTVMMKSRPYPASAEITEDGDQAVSCKERGNSSLHLPSAHQELLHEVEGLCKTGQKLKLLYRSTGIYACQKSTNTVQQ